MKTLIRSIVLALCTVAGAGSAMASGAIVPTPGDTGRLQCKAYDKGSEEHGYHNTCSDCLSEHGSCVVRCYRPTYECRAEGIDREGLPVIVDNNLSRQSRYDAEADAMDRCYRLRLRACRITTCDASQSLESSQTCR